MLYYPGGRCLSVLEIMSAFLQSAILMTPEHLWNIVIDILFRVVLQSTICTERATADRSKMGLGEV